MKKLLTILFLAMLILPVVTALEIDNVVYERDSDYNTGYDKIEIENFFGLGSRLETFDLKTHTAQCLINCESIEEIELFEEGQLVQDILFRDRNGIEVDVPYSLILVEDIEVLIPKYKTECVLDEGSINQSESCNSVSDGEEIIIQQEITPYNFEIKPAGNYTLIINAEKPKGIDIDFVLIAQGKELVSHAWWNNDWNFKKPIYANFTTLSSNNGYQIYINLTWEESYQVDFDDIRFTSSDDITELNHWIENKSDGNFATFWVNTGAINITSTNTTIMNLYYNNSGASSSSNGELTFELFDDFNAFNTTKWIDAGEKSPNISNGELEMDGSFPGNTVFIVSNYGNEYGFITESRMRYVNSESGSMGWYNSTSDADVTERAVSIQYTNIQHGVTVNSSGSGDADIKTSFEGTEPFVNGIARVNPSNIIFFIDYVNELDTALRITQTNTRVGFRDYDIGITYLDWARVRQFVDDTFVWSLGAEEENIATPTVTLNEPEDNLLTNQTTITFNCSATHPTAVLNLSLIVNDTTLEIVTNSSVGVNLSLESNETLDQGNVSWNCQGCGLEGCANGTARTVTVHNTTPEVIIFDPNGSITNFTLGNNLTLNWSVIEAGENLTSHIINCTYVYNGVLTQLNATECLVNNQTSFIYVEGVNNITMFITDAFNLTEEKTSFWNISVLEVNHSFNNLTTEGNIETFLATILLGSGKEISSAVFIYNGTEYIAEHFTSGIYNVLRRADFVIPTIENDTNITFGWYVNLTDPIRINLSENNQTVFNLDLDNCSVFTNVLYNFSLVDEELQTPLSNLTVIETAFNLYSSDKSERIINFSQQFNATNPIGICLNTFIPNGTEYLLDIVVKYEDAQHAVEYYNIVNTTLDNGSSTEFITLYDLLTDDSTEFQITFTGSDFLPVEDALVFINRQYIAENTFKTVELPKTDSNGQTVVHLVRNDIVYNIIVTLGGEVLGFFNNVRAFCDDFTIGDCKILLNAIDEETAIFNYDEEVGILYNSPPTYNSSTQLVSFAFISTDGSVVNVTMDVQVKDIFGNTSVCSNTIVSSAGTLSCNVSAFSTQGNVYVDIFVDETLWLTSIVALDKTAYGSSGYALWFILSIILVLMVGDSKNGVLLSMIIGYIGAVALGWAIGGIVGVGSAGVWILVITFIGIWKINSKKRN